jgi:hypothetical protein
VGRKTADEMEVLNGENAPRHRSRIRPDRFIFVKIDVAFYNAPSQQDKLLGGHLDLKPGSERRSAVHGRLDRQVSHPSCLFMIREGFSSKWQNSPIF